MFNVITKFFCVCGTVSVMASAQLPQPKAADPNPWNGTWALDASRSSPAAVQAGAPHAYRLSLGPATKAVVTVKWEIPEMDEVVAGFTDGVPMPVHRKTPTKGLTLALRSEGSAQLLYDVYRDGTLIGGGHMMLVDNGAAWVDLTWPVDRKDLASQLVYVKQ